MGCECAMGVNQKSMYTFVYIKKVVPFDTTRSFGNHSNQLQAIANVFKVYVSLRYNRL